MNVVILSFFNGLIDRGVETWAKSLQDQLQGEIDIAIIGGQKYSKKIDWNSKNFFYWKFLLLKHVVENFSVWSKADVIIPTNGTIQTFVCRFVSWFTGKSVVVFGHSGPGADDKFNLLCCPDIFVVFSDYQKIWAEKYKLPWTKIIKINHAVNLLRFTIKKEKSVKQVVLSVGANTQDKRMGLVKLAVEKLPGIKFLAVGKDHKFEAKHEEMPEIYHQGDVFCLVPQPWEAFGLVFLEALASNLPVVTTNDPVRKEIIGDAGILVDKPEDVSQLAKALNECLKKNWSDKPRRQAEKFGWSKIRQDYILLFQSLAK